MIKPEDDHRKPGQEALHWLIALQEDPDDPGVRAGFEAWLAENPENGHAWQEAQHLWGVMGEARKPSGHPARSRSPVAPPPYRPPWLRPRTRRLVTVFAAAAAACLVIVVQPGVGIWLQADYATGIAETREVHLEDGSSVFLGADSALDVAFEPGRRVVRLLSGEAYFEVRQDSARPFQVLAGHVDATVLGTDFDVRLLSGGVSVGVSHGRVAVTSSSLSAALTEPLEAGDWVRVGTNGTVERGKDVPERVGGWRTGMLAVKDEAVSDVIEEIGRHYRGKILVTSRAVADKRVTGVYDLGHPVEAVHAIAQAHGARVRQVSPWLLVLSGS